MPRSRKVTTVDQEKKKVKPEKATKTKQTNIKKNVKNTSALNKDQLNIIEIILMAQNNDANINKCMALLCKSYNTVSIIKEYNNKTYHFVHEINRNYRTMVIK